MKKFIIDRFEGEFAICETEQLTFIDILRSALPQSCKEGDCIILSDNGEYSVDNSETTSRKKRIEEKMNRLFE